MPHYLLQVAYTPESWATMVKNPQDRIALVRPAIEKLGGKIKEGYFAFGEYDLIAIVEMKGNVDAAAFAVSAAAGGAVSKLHTTVLMTMAEGVQAMKRASASTYKPPAGKSARRK